MVRRQVSLKLAPAGSRLGADERGEIGLGGNGVSSLHLLFADINLGFRRPFDASGRGGHSLGP